MYIGDLFAVVVMVAVIAALMVTMVWWPFAAFFPALGVTWFQCLPAAGSLLFLIGLAHAVAD